MSATERNQGLMKARLTGTNEWWDKRERGPNERPNATKGEGGRERVRGQANRKKCGRAHMRSGEGGCMCNISGGSSNDGSCSTTAVATTTTMAAAGVAAATSPPAAAGTGGGSAGVAARMAAAGAGTGVAAGATGMDAGAGPTTWPFSPSPLYLFIYF